MKDESLLSLPCSCKLYVRTKFRYATSSGAAANMLHNLLGRCHLTPHWQEALHVQYYA